MIRWRALLGVAFATATLLAPAMARAASAFFVRGGGDGHGIGMSQYGAYGYALHGASYQTILAHYYQGTSLGTTSPDRTVTVLLATGSGSFSGAPSATSATGATGAGSARATLHAATTYTVAPAAGGRVVLSGPSGTAVGTFA